MSVLQTDGKTDRQNARKKKKNTNVKANKFLDDDEKKKPCQII